MKPLIFSLLLLGACAESRGDQRPMPIAEQDRRAAECPSWMILKWDRDPRDLQIYDVQCVYPTVKRSYVVR